MYTESKKYNRIVVFSGGGTRFAIYCGMHAAMQDLNIKPDLIIGACGGAIATSIINAFATNETRKDYLKSKELYSFISNTQLTAERKLNHIGWLSLRKIFNKKNAPIIENVFDTCLVNMPEDISANLPSLVSEMGKYQKSIVIGSKILFNKNKIHKTRNREKLYRKVLFTDKETAQYIDCNKIQILSKNYTESAIDTEIEIATEFPMHTAMRISLSDMFYVQPVLYQNKYYAGGAIDLCPIELAQLLGDYIILEKKRKYTVIEESLVRAVLGYSGNNRLVEINQQPIDHWIDTSNATDTLRGHYCQKHINWTKFQIDISLPLSHQQFSKDMEIQWQYGYNKIVKEFKK